MSENEIPTTAPPELADLKRWIGWRAVWDDDKKKFKKPPYSALTGEKIAATPDYSNHWLTFTEAVAGASRLGLSGVGFVLGDGFVGVDFDDCRENGHNIGEVDGYILQLKTYSEVSPSGKGVHCIGHGKVAKALNKQLVGDARVEIYDHDRYFTFTGKVIGSDPIRNCQFGIDRLVGHLTGGNSSGEPQAAEVKEQNSGPLSATTIRRFHQQALNQLRKALPGERNTILNKICFQVARAFASKALKGSEEEIKNEIRQIARSIQIPDSEFNGTAASGWNSGIQQPYELLPWRDHFHVGSQLEAGEVKMLIAKILVEGVNAIGSLSAVGKTWIALSMARALTTGTKFLNTFEVLEAVNVIYLVPEMGQRALRQRLEKMRVPMDGKFFCQTISDNICKLKDPLLEDAVSELEPVVFLDTAIRFNPSSDENNASQNSALLASDLQNLIRCGAKAVVCLHHSPKYSGEAELMTLENVLRGTGDFGAMCDAVWGLQNDKRKSGSKNGKDWDYEYQEESQNLTRLYVKCVKPRDFEPAAPFRIQGRPYLDERGDFVILTDVESAEQGVHRKIDEAIKNDRTISLNKLRAVVRVGRNQINDLVADAGWVRAIDGKWESHRSGQQDMPF